MTPFSTRRVLQIAGLAAAGLLLTACGRPDEPAPPAAASAVPAAARVYIVGTDAVFAPFESQNESAEIVGFDIDIVQALAKKAGIVIRIINTPSEAIFDALDHGERDMVVSAVAITAQRMQTMDFSDPYFDARQLIAVRQGSKVASFADLRKLKVGVQSGSTGEEAVSRLLGKTSAAIRRFESTPLALDELKAGGVDAVVADSGAVIHYVASNPGGRFNTVTDGEFVPEQYGIALKKGNAELLARLNPGLAAIRADGSYDAIYARYFGTPPQARAAAAVPAAASDHARGSGAGS